MKKIIAIVSFVAVLGSLGYAKTIQTNPSPANSSAVAVDQTGPKFAKYYNDVAALPGFSLGAPAGLSAGWGTAFLGGTYTSNSTTNGGSDGGISMGFGVGDMFKSLAATFTLGLASVNPDELTNEFGNAAYYSASVAHFFEGAQLGIGAGVSNFSGWLPGGRTIGGPSYYVATTKVFPIPYHPIIATIGLGNKNYSDYRNSNVNEVAPFASVGYYIMPQLSYIIDYTAGVTSTGVSIVPVAKLPVVVNVGVYDAFNYIPGHTATSIMFGLSSSFTF